MQAWFLGCLWWMRVLLVAGWRLTVWGVRLAWHACRLALMGVGLLAMLVVAVELEVDRELERQAWRVASELMRWVAVPAPSLDGAPPIVWPVEATRISSGFGTRFNPVTGKTHHHRGVDVPVPVGTPVLASGSGRVTRAAEDALNGRYVVIETGDHLRLAYCHLDTLEVEAGGTVDAGQRIGTSGNTGRSTGPHLHFGVWWHRRAVDPMRLRRVSAGSLPARPQAGA